jgi:hypothetical protein
LIYNAIPGQVSYGESIGILLLDSSLPYIPGDVANATTYPFAVRFQKVEGFSAKRAFDLDSAIYDDLLVAARQLAANGVRAITGNCGYMAIHQRKLINEVNVPIFLSSLSQLSFINQIIPSSAKIAIVTANSKSLTHAVLDKIGITYTANLKIIGMEKHEHFRQAVIVGDGRLDSDKLEKEMFNLTKTMVEEDAQIKAILLECSLLSPYGYIVREATRLPVFDYVTMINYVYSTVVKQKFNGYM